MAAAMRGCEYEYVAERERGLQTVARTSSYRYRYALPLCVLNGGLGLFFNPAPALTEPTPKIIGAHMAEISIQEIEAPAHASAHRHGRARSFQCVRRVVCPESERSGEQSAFQHIDSDIDIRLRHRAKNAPRPDQRSKMLCVQRVSCPESERIKFRLSRYGAERRRPIAVAIGIVIGLRTF